MRLKSVTLIQSAQGSELAFGLVRLSFWGPACRPGSALGYKQKKRGLISLEKGQVKRTMMKACLNAFFGRLHLFGLSNS